MRVRIGKQRVDSEVSVKDKGGTMEMDTANYGFRPDTIYTTHV